MVHLRRKYQLCVCSIKRDLGKGRKVTKFTQKLGLGSIIGGGESWIEGLETRLGLIRVLDANIQSDIQGI
jgi:hypothetical protein